MALITWTKEQYGTNVNVCDDEHKTLFDKLNKLYDLATSGAARAAVGAQLDDLISYVAEHFATEERLMQSKNYSGYAAHKAEHDKLVATCVDLQAKFHKGEAEVTAETGAFVKGWLDSHIPKFDMPYEPSLNS
jgi:hemerythrin